MISDVLHFLFFGENSRRDERERGGKKKKFNIILFPFFLFHFTNIGLFGKNIRPVFLIEKTFKFKIKS